MVVIKTRTQKRRSGGSRKSKYIKRGGSNVWKRRSTISETACEGNTQVTRVFENRKGREVKKSQIKVFRSKGPCVKGKGQGNNGEGAGTGSNGAVAGSNGPGTGINGAEAVGNEPGPGTGINGAEAVGNEPGQEEKGAET